MEKSAMLDKALELVMGDLDDMEGSSAMSHSMDECPDPLTCGQHDSDLGDGLSKEPAAVSIEVHKGLPSLDGEKAPSLDDKGEDGEDMSPEDAEILRKLLSK